MSTGGWQGSMGGRWKAGVAAAVVALMGAPGIIIGWSEAANRPDVVISEVMTSNGATLLDEDLESADWIELWNRSSTRVDLTGWRLSDDAEGDPDWTMPRLSLEAGDRMVIFTSGKSDRYRLHANFRLSADGEHVALYDASGREVAEQDVPALGTDVSYGVGSDGAVGVLITPTPGLPNSPTKPPAVAKPVLSRAGGYIDGNVSVTATTSTDGAQLWYTTNGSTPTTGHGVLYTGPISVNATTTLRMVATRDGFSDSFVASATYLVMDEVLAQTGTPLGWSTAPVNGQVFQFGFDQQYVDRHRTQVADALDSAPTLSITTDLENLIDPATGIYSNPAQSGAAWERPASIELIDGAAGFQTNGGVRVKGGYSRDTANPKHNFRLTFGLQYEEPLSYPLFGTTGVQTFASVDLRAEQNHGWQWGSPQNTMMRDQFIRDTQAAVGDPSTRSRWVHLFLNGQYWGLYMLRDDVTPHQAAAASGGASGDYDVLKHSNDLDFGANQTGRTDWGSMWMEHAVSFGYEVDGAGDDVEWLQLWAAIEDGELSEAEFAVIDDLTDLANLADFMLINIAVGNNDSAPSQIGDQLANNWQAVRGSGQPFRFFLDDCEAAMGVNSRTVDIDRTGPFPVADDNEFWVSNAFNPGWLHQVLLTRSEYRSIFRTRATTLLGPGGALTADASLARWTELRDQLDPLIEAEAARWGYAGAQKLGRPQWEEEVEWVETVWFPNRDEIVLDQLRADHLIDI